MRVRLFELRLLALLLFVLWSAFFAAVLVGYHPGGPLDWVVGATAVSPVIVAALGVLWPPLATGNRASSALGWLGILAALLLIPSIQNLAGFLLGTAGQPLLPAPEVAYAAVVALFATCLFAGLGVARQILGPGAHRRRRLGLGVLVAIAMTALAASPFTATALANEIAIRSRTPPASAYGPVGPDAAPPACDGALAAGPFAEISETATAAVVATRVGSVALAGARSGADERWSASQALH
ncbi:MAG TPA: hypothetical protein VFW86_03730, partial [Candidatus Limnocylindrales bacterium]|nr:hypothetical protein [Candidatus Limnocylindrales bacterium]